MPTISPTQPLWAGHGLSLTGWGHYFPRHHEQQPPHTLPEPTPAELAVFGPTLGVLARHVAAEDETVEFMAERAARQALRQAEVAAEDLDLLVLSSWTDRENVPEHAPRVARMLGARQALAFNVGGACIGFVHGVHLAASMLVAQGLRRALVVVSDRFSTRLADRDGWGNRLGGDGAAAAVLEVTGDEGGLHDSVMFSFGEHASVAAVSKRTGVARSLPKIADVAAETAALAVEELLRRNELKLSDVDWLVAHPGSQRVLDTVRDRLCVDPDRLLTNFANRGSTSAATVPSAISEFLESGRISKGDKVITPAMGSGWFSGALLLTL